jgi:sugar lactone lactonase YvrE
VTCEKQNCELSPDWVLHSAEYSVGSHIAEAIVEDRVHHVVKREVSFTIEKDTTAPEITTLSKATEGSYGSGIYPVQATSNDKGTGIAKVELLVNGKRSGAASTNPCAEAEEDEEEGHCFTTQTSNSQVFKVNMAEYPPGSQALELLVTDGAGNVARKQGTMNVETGLGATGVAPSLILSGTMTEQASLGKTRPRYVLAAEAGAGNEGGSENSSPTYLSSFGTTEPGKLSGIRGIAADGKGHVWVVDRSNNRVVEYTEAGSYVRQFGTGGSGNGQLSEPWGVTVSAAGNVWVTDTGNHRIEEFNEKGEYLQKFGTAGASSKGTEFLAPEGIATGPGGMLWVSDGAGSRVAEFRETVSSEAERFVRNTSGGGLVTPIGLALDGAGNVWVADEGANHLLEYSSEGAYLRTVGTSGSGAGQLSSPKGVVVAPSGNVVVVDRGNNRVEEFKPNGEFLYSLGSAGSGNGQLSEPRGIALGAGNTLFVADKGNNRVQKWGPGEGPAVFVSAFGSLGSGNGQFNGLRGIASDGKGHVWVVDRNNSRIQEFNEKGEYIRQFGTAGSGNGQLSEPWGVAVSAAGNVWVTDTGNDRIEEFNEKGEYLQKFGTAGATSKGTEFVQAEGIATAPGGMLWVSDLTGNRVAEFRESVSSESERFVRNTSGGSLTKPLGLGLDNSGNLWVADEAANHLVEYSAEGAYLQTVGAPGSGNGQLSGPKGLSVSPAGNIYVVDRGNSRIDVFKPSGEFLYSFGSAGSGDGQLSEPRGISVAFGAGDDLFIADAGNNRVQKWTQAGIAKMEISLDGTVVATSPSGCATANCEVAREWVLNSGAYSVGTHTAVVKVTNEAGIATTKTLAIEIQRDTSKPSLTVGGAAVEGPDGWLEQHKYGLSAEATDGAGTGVRSLVLKVDGLTAESVSRSCPEGGCRASLNQPLNMADYSGGSHTVQLVGTDGAGNTATSTWTMHINPEGYIGPGEAARTLEAAEETAGVNIVGSSSSENMPGTLGNLGLTEGEVGVEATGAGTRVAIAAATKEEPCTVYMQAAPDETPEDKATTETGAESLEEPIYEAWTAAATEESELEPGEENTYIPLGEPLEVTEGTSADKNCEPAIVNGAAAVEPSTDSQVDTVVRPLYDGSMNFKSIRSAEASEVYEWEVELTPGQTVKQVDPKNIQVSYEDGTPAVAITAPQAHDATGAAVPTSLSIVNGRTIALQVHFKEQGPNGQPFVFPILAGASYQVGTEEVTVVYPPVESDLETEAAGAEVSELSAHRARVHSAAFGAPVLLLNKDPSRSYRFNDCVFYTGDTGVSIPGDPHLRYEPNGSSPQCHSHEGLKVGWAVAVFGRFWYEWKKRVWVEDAPECNQWGDWGKPWLKGCYVNHHEREAKWPNKVNVMGDWRFKSGLFSSSQSQEMCLEIDGVLPAVPQPSENGERVYFENYHEGQGAAGFEGKQACNWEHLPVRIR